MLYLRKVLRILFGVLIFNSFNIFAEEIGTLSAELDTGMLLDRNNKIFQQEKLQRTLKHEKKKHKHGIENLEEKKEEEVTVSDISFLLKAFEISKSEILTEEEIAKICKPYIEKEVTTAELYSIIQKINELYQKKGYLVCNAILPEQKIQNGLVKIVLIEGKTGDITIQGNHSTREKYIRERIPLKKNKVSSFKELDESLMYFNLTNDSPIRINIASGRVPETTDYVVQIYEPKRQQFFVFTDNLGQKNTGELRLGFNYTNNSLTGNRDQVSLTALVTEGTASLSSFYTFPISKKGTKMSLQHSVGKLKHTQGALKHKITGNSYSYGLGIVHPVLVYEKNKIELSLDWVKQKTSTDLLKLKWVNNMILKYTAGIGISHYEEDSIFYTKQNITKGKFTSISGHTKNYTKYDMFLMYQKNLKYNTSATLRMTGQYSLSKKLPSVEQIYAGGAYNVRGYPESFMGAEHGVFFNIELSKLADQEGEIFAFWDGASLHGNSAYRENRIFSSGFGYKKRFLERSNIAVSMAFPWKKKINSTSIDSNRIYITVNHEF